MSAPITGRRKNDDKINERIDGIMVEFGESRQEIIGILSGLSSRVENISDDLASNKHEVSILTNDLRIVAESLKSINDILVAWNNTKGFINTMKFISGFAKILMPIVFITTLITGLIMFFYNKFDW